MEEYSARDKLEYVLEMRMEIFGQQEMEFQQVMEDINNMVNMGNTWTGGTRQEQPVGSDNENDEEEMMRENKMTTSTQLGEWTQEMSYMDKSKTDQARGEWQQKKDWIETHTYG